MNSEFNINNHKDNPFITPDNYFEKLPEKILLNCKKDDIKSSIPYKKIFQYAASVAIIISMSFFIFFNNNNIKHTQIELSSHYDDILFLADLHDVDDITIKEYIADNNNENKLTQNDIIDYLFIETENTDDLIELLDY